jgi:hypothetical protein
MSDMFQIQEYLRDCKLAKLELVILVLYDWLSLVRVTVN